MHHLQLDLESAMQHGMCFVEECRDIDLAVAVAVVAAAAAVECCDIDLGTAVVAAAEEHCGIDLAVAVAAVKKRRNTAEIKLSPQTVAAALVVVAAVAVGLSVAGVVNILAVVAVVVAAVCPMRGATWVQQVPTPPLALAPAHTE